MGDRLLLRHLVRDPLPGLAGHRRLPDREHHRRFHADPRASERRVEDGLSQRGADRRAGPRRSEGIRHPARPLVSGPHADRARVARPLRDEQPAPSRSLERPRLGVLLAHDIHLPPRRARVSPALLVWKHHRCECPACRRGVLFRGVLPLDSTDPEPSVARACRAGSERREPVDRGLSRVRPSRVSSSPTAIRSASRPKAGIAARSSSSGA